MRLPEPTRGEGKSWCLHEFKTKTLVSPALRRPIVFLPTHMRPSKTASKQPVEDVGKYGCADPTPSLIVHTEEKVRRLQIIDNVAFA